MHRTLGDSAQFPTKLDYVVTGSPVLASLREPCLTRGYDDVGLKCHIDGVLLLDIHAPTLDHRNLIGTVVQFHGQRAPTRYPQKMSFALLIKLSMFSRDVDRWGRARGGHRTTAIRSAPFVVLDQIVAESAR